MNYLVILRINDGSADPELDPQPYLYYQIFSDKDKAMACFKHLSLSVTRNLTHDYTLDILEVKDVDETKLPVVRFQLFYHKDHRKSVPELLEIASNISTWDVFILGVSYEQKSDKIFLDSDVYEIRVDAQSPEDACNKGQLLLAKELNRKLN